MSDFRFRSFLLLMLPMGSSSALSGQGGRMSVGSRSSAPRATILVIRFCAFVLACMEGTGGAVSGEGTRAVSLCRDFGRRIVDALRNLFGLEKFNDPSRGAVWGVMGVYGEEGVLPLTRVSYGFFEGVIAILARESFMDIDRNRLCATGFLMMGDAALVLAFS